ncbi:uncharacterized protein LOC114746273 [Neltuma alba]|uniref:uncharacterized protein LOC114746273 n=1 Tax=Neltuma alba TaxID=207710 RepID=UPI0010A4CD69|nr:uncharacterized protein LOC114746273 [Prosopis alba]
MNVAVVNSSTITKFVDDKNTFDKFVRERLALLDEDGDGVLSPDDVRGGFSKLLPLGYYPREKDEIDGLCRSVFERFDEDQNGWLDGNEFKSFMTEIMNALARGIGGSPLVVVLEQGSFLSKAVHHELARDSAELLKPLVVRFCDHEDYNPFSSIEFTWPA